MYFRVLHVAKYFNNNSLRKSVADKTGSYKQGVDYIYIDIPKARNSLFLTYTGLLRCSFVSRSVTPSHFFDWSIKTLFATQFDTKDKINKLVSNIKGIPYDIVGDIFLKNAGSVACVYLISLGTVKQLRTIMNIDSKYHDDDIVSKFGFTADFKYRMNGHKNEYGDIGVVLDLNLTIFACIDPIFLPTAEKDIKFFCKDIKAKYKKHEEIVIVSRATRKDIKMLFKNISQKYSGNSAQFEQLSNEMTQQINELQDTISQAETTLVQIKKQHRMELTNQSQQHQIELANVIIEKNDEINKMALRYKDLEIAKNEEINKMVLRYKDLEIAKNEEIRRSESLYNEQRILTNKKVLSTKNTRKQRIT